MAAGPGAGEVADIHNDYGLEVSRYQQNLNPLTGQKLSAGEYLGKLTSENPYLMQANPQLAYSLAQQYKSGLLPSDVNSQLHLAKMIQSVTQPYQKLYGSNVGMYDTLNEKQPGWWQQAVTEGTNWFDKNIFSPIRNFIGSNPIARDINTNLRYVLPGGADLQTGVGTASGTVDLIGGLSMLGVNTANDVRNRTLQNGGDINGALAETLGHGLYSAAVGPHNLLFTAKHYYSYYKSLENMYGSDYAMGTQIPALLAGAFTGGLATPGAEAGAAATEVIAPTIEDQAALDAARATIDQSPEASAFKQLLDKAASGWPISSEERVQMEALIDHLKAQDSQAVARATFENMLGKARELATSKVEGVGYNEINDAFSQFNLGKISLDEFKNVAAKYLGESQQIQFNSAADELFSATAKASDAANIAGNAILKNGDAYLQKFGEQVTKNAGRTLRLVGNINKLIGGKQANATYLYAAAQAQADPHLSALWQATQGGDVINADGTRTDLGLALANSVGIDGMWGTFTKSLIDLDLNWVVTDPFGSGLDAFKEARSFHGYSGILGNLFPGTGIRVEGDVHRAYASYSSVRRAVNYIATHDFSQINKAFKNTFSRSLAERLAEAKTPQEVLSILEDVRGGLDIVGDRMPMMGWYSMAKTALRGVPSEEFATIGDALASEDPLAQALIRSIDEQTGVDLTINDVGFALADPASKAEIKLGEKLRAQFTSRPMSIEDGQILDYEVRNGSPASIVKMTDWLKRVYMSDEFVKAAGDALTRAGNDNEKWNHAFDNIMSLVLYRHMAASMPYAQFLPHLDMINSKVQEALRRFTGLDGGGAMSGIAYGGGEKGLIDSKVDQVIKENPGPLEPPTKTAGIDEYNLGARRIPAYRNIRDLARFATEVVTATKDSDLLKFIADENSRLSHIEALAQHAGVDIERALESWKPEENAFLMGSQSGAEAYVAKSKELIERYIGKGSTIEGVGAEKYANIVKDLQDEIAKGTEYLKRIDSELDRIHSENVDPAKAIREQLGENIGQQIDRLAAEVRASKDMLATLKKEISFGFKSMPNVRRTAEYVASLAEHPDVAAKNAYAKAFVEKWGELSSQRAFGKIGSFLNHTAISHLLERGYRSRSGVAEDIIQWYMNAFWKPLALLSQAWALHVSLSEGILNTIRIGGGNFFKAKLASSITKYEDSFGKLYMGERERRVFRDSVAAFFLGIDQGLLKGMAPAEYDRLMQNATNLFILNDGHLPLGVHGTGKDLSGDGFKVAQLEDLPVIGSDGEIKMRKGTLTDTHTKYRENDKYAGSALYQTITSSHQGLLSRTAAQLLDAEQRRLGQLEFDKLVTGGKDPAFYENLINRRAEAEVRKQGKVSLRTGKVSEKATLVERGKARDQVLRELGAAQLNLEEFRPKLVQQIEDLIGKQSVQWRSRFERNSLRSAAYPELEPHAGWANSVVDHVLGITTRNNEIFPDLVRQVAHGDFWSREETAKWLNNKVRMGENVPTGFPAYAMAEGRWKQIGSSGFAYLNEKIHSKWLAPIVNSLIRDPMFVYEYHIEMERLLPKVESGLISEDAAMIEAQSNAAVHMSKYIHNPLDKSTWEENMRIIAPFYFAKNQAWRRAFRLLGEDPAKFEKYLKTNLLYTNYIQRARSKNGVLSYHIPGSQYVVGWVNGVLGAALHDNIGSYVLQASGNSSDSYIITGNSSSLTALADNFIQVPYSNVVTVPAKIVYDYAQFRHPMLAKFIAGFPGIGLGQAGMLGSWKSDLIPSSFLQNIEKGAWGLISGDHVGTYVTLENHVITSKLEVKYAEIYNQVAEHLIKTGQITRQDAKNGTAGTQIQYYALMQLSQWAKDPENIHAFTTQANLHTAVLWAIKTFGSFLSPAALSVSSTQSAQQDIAKIAQMKGPDGKFLYPSYIDQANEFMKLHPTRIFELVPHTSSPEGTFLENVGTTKFLNEHAAFALQYRYLTAAITPSIGKDAQYDPAAATLLLSLHLRDPMSVKDTADNLSVIMGNDLYYSTVMPQFQKNYPGNYQNGMSRQGVQALKSWATGYGQTTNPLWYADFTGKVTKFKAQQAYEEAKQVISNKSNLSQLPLATQQALGELVNLRKEYEQAFKGSSKSRQYQLENEWYNYMTNLTTQKIWQPYSNLIISVFRKLPNPQ